MRFPRCATSILALLCLYSHSACAEERQTLGTISWILGDWIRTGEKISTRESWKKLSDGVFKGSGVVASRKGNVVRSQESLLLVEMSGEVFYIAKVKQNKYPVAFKLTSCSSKHAVFENPEHDFPKKLEYRLITNGTMKVTISDGGDRSFTIPFQKETKKTNAANRKG